MPTTLIVMAILVIIVVIGGLYIRHIMSHRNGQTHFGKPVRANNRAGRRGRGMWSQQQVGR